tara:strand:+ start:1989 stop:3152 length:1164 start_codon:yes stop_codon:yes gene_type:complete
MITINPQKLVENVNTRGEFIFRGGLALQAELGAQNVRQFGRFLRTPQGARFVAKQVILQASNPSRKELKIKKDQPKVESPYQTTQIYNPGAPILAKGLSQELTKLKPNRHINQGGIFKKLGNTIGEVKDGIKSIDENIDNFVKNIFNRANGGTQTNAVTYFANNQGDQHQLQVRYGGSGIEKSDLDKYPNRKGQLGNEVKDFIKFRIRDAVNGRYIIFPALLSGGISDNSSAEVSPINYIGRADKVYVYGGYTRSISFSVNIVAQRKSDIPIIWEKINYAKGLVLPQYKEFFAKTEKGVTDRTRPVAPLCYLTLGDLFNNAPGYFSSVNMSIPESATWELSNGEQVPHICSLAFEFTYIGKESPTMTSKHYGDVSKKFKFKEGTSNG